jgi:ribosomal protein S18 acetylase RimI-like enzyme
VKSSEIAVEAARPQDVEVLATLFEAYRAFYRRAPDPDAARSFVAERVAAGDTRFFLARAGREVVGFVHLVPSFDTLAMSPMWLLEDLFVLPERRRRGVGDALLRHAESFARASGASRLTLSTAHTNRVAQRRYEASGYRHDEEFRTYHRSLR